MVASRADDGGNVLEYLSDYIRRLENVHHIFANMDIILSTQVQDAAAALEEDWDIRKMPVVWPLMDYKMFYIVTVPPNTTVPKHRHDEVVFRMIVDGELTINDFPIKQGEWIVVKKDVDYIVKTVTGYKALSAYRSVCRTGRGFDARDKDVTPPGG